MMKTARCTLADLLTAEILVEILIRLPLESILVCRKVCKSWNDLILQPFFAELHRSYSCPPFTIMLVHTPHLQERSTFGLITGDDHIGYELNYTDKVIQHIPDLNIVGSCNGLICLSSFDRKYFETHYPPDYPDDDFRLVLCNPTLGSHMNLPDPPPVPFGFSALGFGYVPSTCQYKVVKMQYMEDKRRLLFHVCTIQSGNNKKKMSPLVSAWRTISHNADNLPLLAEYSDPTFFKGSVIWIAESKTIFTEFRGSPSLIYFDIEKEDMQTILLPPTIFTDYEFIRDCVYNDAVKIGVYYDHSGNECLYICEELPSCANIWVMEEHQSINSLKLKWVILLGVRERLPTKLFRVLKDGRLLIGIKNSTLAYYDPNTRLLQTMESLHFPFRSHLALDTPNLLGCLL